MHNYIFDFCPFRQFLCMKDCLGYFYHNFIIALNESILFMDILKHTIFMHNLVICKKLVECPINVFSICLIKKHLWCDSISYESLSIGH
jgi:hypothetical protein